jgi:serine/threonine protein kinase
MDEKEEFFSHFLASVNSLPIWNQISIFGKQLKVLVNYSDIYLKIKKLGEGGFSEVHLVKSLCENRHYAMKESLIENEKNLKLVLKEYKVLNFMNSKHLDVPEVYDCFFFTSQGRLYSVLKQQYIKGMDMFFFWSYLKEQDYSLSEEMLLKFAYWLTKNLQIIHSLGYAHRDIKLENIMMDIELKKFYILDFGLAVKFRKRNQKVYNAGTHILLAPERTRNISRSRGSILLRRGSIKYLPKNDIWSLGIILYCLAYKKYPWKEEKDLYLLYQEISNCDPKCLVDLDYPSKINQLLLFILEKDKVRRPSTEKILEKINSFLEY